MSKKHNRVPEVDMVPNDTEVAINEHIEELEATVEETPVAPKTIYGTVFKCSMVNIRKAPEKNAPVVATIRRNNTVTIDMEESTAEFYKVRTLTGVEGFCMREFIQVQE